MPNTAINLTAMTKNALVELAKDRGIDLKNISKTPKNEVISLIAQVINAENGVKKERIRNAVTALLDLTSNSGKNLDALNGISQSDFLNTVLSVAPGWQHAADDAKVKKHFAWYKSNYRKNHGGLVRPRLTDEQKAERKAQAEQAKAAKLAAKEAAKTEDAEPIADVG